ncbi:hypothetical protein PXD04_05075 [Methanosphaera sp. ISO3-F5]|uniref:hypothetical protein n=1 Tax=Methanosphaera sp. ISO3-F5 TaxID=1452353 RepID=UPI002B259B18|nr:hypothetical protein [Methanosphaera sp. ISO3-F5]WQH65155.1 glycosyltransferase family 39 protein [Methanosphaera sp. ISO3-F5]
MNLFLKEDKKLLVLPAILSFILTLLLLYKYSFPISWDVYYHIHMINLYANNGLVFWDNLTVAPKGRLIMYPPLFHLVFAGISKTLNISSIELCRCAQPLFSAYLIGIITFTTYKITNVRTSFLTGFLAMFCFITFNRSVICTPATIAIGLFLIAIVYCYNGIIKENYKEIIISAISLALIWNLHMATAILTSGVIGLYILIQLLKKHINLKIILCYCLIVLCLGLPWWIYIAINYTLVFNSISGTDTIITNFFFKYFGVITTILLLIGYYVLFKKKTKLSIFLLSSSLSLILLSQIKYLGFNTVSIRILEVASYVLIIISGIGLNYIYDNKITQIQYKNLFVALVILLSVSSALLYEDSYTPDLMGNHDVNNTIIDEHIHLIVNPVVTLFKPTVISSRFADNNLAHNRYEIMKYFEENTPNGMLISEDAIMDTIIVSTSSTPVAYGGFTESIPDYVTDPVHIIKGWSNKNEIHQLNISHILLKKDTAVPYYAEIVKENDNYKICKIRQEYR